jgi:Tfp pilus assembly protein FimT
MKIVVVTQQLELNGVIGRTIAALLLGLAEIEHGNIRERQRQASKQQRLVAFLRAVRSVALRQNQRDLVS